MSTPYALLPQSEQRQKAEQLARQLLAQWQLSEIPLTLLSDGFNTTFKGQGPEGPLVVRLHRRDTRPLSAFEVEWRWTQALREAGVDVPEVVLTQAGEHVVLLESEDETQPVALTLFRWQEGTILWEAKLPEAELLAALEKVGHLAAQLHTHTSTFRELDHLSPNHRHWMGLIEEHLSAEQLSPGLGELYLQARERAIAVYEADAASPLQLCHADYHGGNILLRPSGEVALLDFDDCLLATRACDLGITCFYLLERHPGHPALLSDLALGRIHAVKRGYTQHHPWPMSDKSMVDFMLARQLVLLNMLGESRNEAGQARFEAYARVVEGTLKHLLSL